MSQPNIQAELHDQLEQEFSDYVIQEFGAKANNTDPHDLMNYEEWLNMRDQSDIREGEE